MRSAWRGSNRFSLVLYVLIIAVSWGLMYTSYKIGLERSGPLWLASLRFEFFAGAALIAGLLIPGALRWPAGAGDWGAVAAYAGLNVILHNLGTIGGAAFVPTAVIGVLAGTTPILTAGFAQWLLPDQRLTRTTLIGLACGFAGVAVLTTQRSEAGAFALSGWTLLVGAGFACWALGTVLIRASGSKLHGLSLGLWGSLIAVLVLQPLAFALEPVPDFDLTLIGVAAFAGLVGGVLAFLLWLGLVRRYGPRNANLVSYVSPIATTLSGVIFLKESVGVAAFGAYALIALGLGLVVRDLPKGLPTQPDQRVMADAADMPDA
jgi:probable blue pigment (indigoidine) exporter